MAAMLTQQYRELGEEYADFSLTREEIKYDLGKIRAKWRELQQRHLTDHFAEEATRIDHLERVYWNAWATHCSNPEAAWDSGKKFLEGVQWCIERRCALFGLDAPRRQQIEVQGYAEFSTPDLIAEARRVLAEFGRSETGFIDSGTGAAPPALAASAGPADPTAE